MMKRTQAPELNLIDRLDINNFKKTSLSNGVEVYYVNSAEEDLIRIELRFRAGRWYEPKHAISRAVCNLMRKGTSTKTAKQIADIIEFYGAHLDVQSGQDYTSMMLFCLSKHLDKIMPVAEEILLDATFPQDEMCRNKNKNYASMHKTLIFMQTENLMWCCLEQIILTVIM